MPATVGSALRNSSDLQILHTNYRLYYTSLLPSAVHDWNELPEQTRNSPSLNIFKNKLKFNLITPPRYYNTGKRLGQILHARLRTACSPLRQHLHSKIIVDSPYCTCGDIKDTHYFLFVCHQFTDLRRDLINSVSDICQPNFNVLLCGDISLTFDKKNKQIFKAVKEFIIKSKRFNIHINASITHCICMKHTSMFSIIVLFQICFVYT